MKILDNSEKKAKKQEYKNSDIDIFFDKEEAFQHNRKKETRQFVPDYFKTKDFNEYNKRANKYLYHYRRLLEKRDFLRKRILNLNCFEKGLLFKSKANFDLMMKIFTSNEMDKTKESMFEVMAYVSDYKAVEEVNVFAYSVRKFSSLIKQLSDIVDTIDPKNKDKFVYDREKLFHDKVKKILIDAKIKFLPIISKFCNTFFR